MTGSIRSELRPYIRAKTRAVVADGAGSLLGARGTAVRSDCRHRALMILGALALGACASTPERPMSRVPTGGAAPHYKIGATYQVAGRSYQPRLDRAYDETGMASWYGDDFHGRATANGERFNKRELTAAHKTLPLPSFVEVTNLANGRRVVVRVNDRGPFVADRVIDLSEAAAATLGFREQGVAQVRVRYLADAPLPGERIARAPWGSRSDATGVGPTSSASVTAGVTATPGAEARAGDVAATATPARSAGATGDLATLISTETQAVSGLPAGAWIALGRYAGFDEAEAAHVRAHTALAHYGADVAMLSETDDMFALAAGPFASDALAREAMIVMQSQGFQATPGVSPERTAGAGSFVPDAAAPAPSSN